MAIPILAPLDFNKNEIRNVLVHLLASDPGSPTVGQIWFNTGSSKLKVYDGAVRVIAELSDPLNTLGAPTAALNMNSQLISSLATPVSGTDAATKAYVDSVALGLDVKASVRAATTVAGTLATSFANGQVIDGITLATGDRILVKNQAAGAENGIYIVTAGAPTRSTDFNSTTNAIPGAFVFTELGTANAGVSFVVATQGVITPGTTAISFVQFLAGATYSAGSGLTLTGTVFSLNVSGTSIEISAGNARVKSSATSGQPLLSAGTGVEATYGALNVAGGAGIVTGALPVANGGTGATTAALARAALGVPGKFSISVGNGSLTSIVVNHALGTQDVEVMVYLNSAPFSQVFPEVQLTDANTVTLVFAVAPTSTQYRCVVMG